MKTLLLTSLLLTLVSCNGGSGSASSLTATNTTTNYQLKVSDVFDSFNSTMWSLTKSATVAQNFAANSTNVRSVKLVGSTTSEEYLLTGKTHIVDTSFTIIGFMGFDNEQALGNGFDVIYDYGNGDKIVATFYISSVPNYVSFNNAANDTQASFNYKVYNNNAVVYTSATQVYGAIQNDFDSEHTFIQQYQSVRSNRHMMLDIQGTSGFSVSMDVNELTYSLGQDVVISVRAFGGASNNMALTIDNFDTTGTFLGYR